MIVTTRKVPFRLSIRDRRPLLLEVLVRNTASRERKYVITVEADKHLSLKPSGLALFDTTRTGTVYPGEQVTVTFKIFPRATTTPGTYPVRVIVEECVDDYDNIVSTKEISVKVPVV